MRYVRILGTATAFNLSRYLFGLAWSGELPIEATVACILFSLSCFIVAVTLMDWSPA